MKLDYGWENPKSYRKWGPYLSYGKDASNEMRISWESKFFSMETHIEYGEDEQCSKKIQIKHPPKRHFTVTLKDLKPSTTYYFKIYRPEELHDLQEGKEVPVYSFTTGPQKGSKEKFDFCFISDVHTEGGNFSRLLRSIKTNAPNTRFIVTGGDCVTHGGVEGAWNEFFYELAPYSTDFALMNATGNHDTDHPESYAHFIATFDHPYENTEYGAYYYFVYGNAVFIMLDSDNAGQTKARQGVVSEEQWEWLEETLEKFSKEDYWIFLVMHHPYYTTGDSGMMMIYELAYRDLILEHKVDAVLFGHDHHFEVYWNDREKDWGGTHYFLAGNGGGSLSLFNRNPKRNPHYLWKGRTYVFERDGVLGGNPKGRRNDEIIKKAFIYGVLEHGFLHFSIEGDSCEIKMIGLENELYFHDRIKRTGTGKKYHRPLYMAEF